MTPELEKLVLKLIEQNPTWSSNRIVGALDNLGYTLSDSTIDNIRQRHGFDPAPVRRKTTTWRSFLKAHWEILIAADFFTTEVLTWNGLFTFYTFFVIELRSRWVHVCGTTVSPNADWMGQVARQLVDAVDGFASGKTHLILDRDTKYCESFQQILQTAGVKIVRCQPRVPQCNAHAERFVRSIKEECLSRLIFLSAQHLRSTIALYAMKCQSSSSAEFFGSTGLMCAPITGPPLPMHQATNRSKLSAITRRCPLKCFESIARER